MKILLVSSSSDILDEQQYSKLGSQLHLFGMAYIWIGLISVVQELFHGVHESLLFVNELIPTECGLDLLYI